MKIETTYEYDTTSNDDWCLVLCYLTDIAERNLQRLPMADAIKWMSDDFIDWPPGEIMEQRTGSIFATLSAVVAPKLPMIVQASTHTYHVMRIMVILMTDAIIQIAT